MNLLKNLYRNEVWVHWILTPEKDSHIIMKVKDLRRSKSYKLLIMESEFRKKINREFLHHFLDQQK